MSRDSGAGAYVQSFGTGERSLPLRDLSHS